jgi:hypothetical protein
VPLGARVYDFHPSPVVEDDLLTEDYGFCKLWTDLGGSVWAAPWPHVIHAGSYRYAGSFEECQMADVAVAA